MKRVPTYNLNQARSLVAQGDYLLTKKVTDSLRNHGYDSGETVEEVFDSLSEDGFHKTIPLDKRPDTYADVYFADYDGDRWYVKFFIEDDGGKIVDVWSCRPDGFTA